MSERNLIENDNPQSSSREILKDEVQSKVKKKDKNIPNIKEEKDKFII